eukprot:scaffold165989_cov17-Tisochrysis_lutea.AAC.2
MYAEQKDVKGSVSALLLRHPHLSVQIFLLTSALGAEKNHGAIKQASKTCSKNTGTPQICAPKSQIL